MIHYAKNIDTDNYKATMHCGRVMNAYNVDEYETVDISNVTCPRCLKTDACQESLDCLDITIQIQAKIDEKIRVLQDEYNQMQFREIEIQEEIARLKGE